jgi:hypothetical protein
VGREREREHNTTDVRTPQHIAKRKGNIKGNSMSKDLSKSSLITGVAKEMFQHRKTFQQIFSSHSYR